MGQEHAPTETSRPLSTGPHPCGRLQSFGAARPAKFRGLPSFATPLIGFGAHGARPHIHPTVTVGGPIGTRFAMAFMYSLSSANTSELSSS